MKPPLQTLLALALVTGSSAICNNNTKHALFRCMLTGYEKTSRPGLDSNKCETNMPPVSVTSQFVVKVLTKVDQRLGSYEVEGYMRLRWRDERLAFNSSAYCQPSIVLTSATGLWVPDVYFEHSVTLQLGDGHDGEVVYIYPDGSVVWSRFVACLACARRRPGVPLFYHCVAAGGLVQHHASAIMVQVCILRAWVGDHWAGLGDGGLHQH